MEGDGQKLEATPDQAVQEPRIHPDDEAFVATIERLHGSEAIMDVRVAGITDASGTQWIVGLTGCVQTLHRDDIDIPSCKQGAFRRELIPLKEIVPFLASVRTGVIKVEGVDFRISSEKVVHLHYDSYEPHDLAPRAVSLNDTARNLPSDIPSIRTINRQLRAAAPPWDGMDDVGQHFLGLEPDRWGDNHHQIIKFWVDYPVAVQSVQAAESSLEVYASASMPGQLRDLEMRLVLTRRGEVFSRQVVKPFEDEDPVAAQASIPVGRGDTGSYQAKVFIHWHEQAIGTTTASFHSEHEEPMSHRALALFADSPTPLVDRWDVVHNKSDWFEDWTVHLFNSIGLMTMPLHKGLDGPDLVAYDTDHPSIWVVECTMRTINNSGKLGKLLERTKQVQSKVANSTQTAFSVIATALSRENIAKHELDAAGEDDIIVLAKEDLLELAEGARAPMTPEDLHWWMLRRREGGSLPTHWMGRPRRLF